MRHNDGSKPTNRPVKGAMQDGPYSGFRPHLEFRPGVDADAPRTTSGDIPQNDERHRSRNPQMPCPHRASKTAGPVTFGPPRAQRRRQSPRLKATKLLQRWSHSAAASVRFQARLACLELCGRCRFSSDRNTPRSTSSFILGAYCRFGVFSGTSTNVKKTCFTASGKVERDGGNPLTDSADEFAALVSDYTTCQPSLHLGLNEEQQRVVRIS
ncbi:hypothetical protein B0H14DRAFT_2578090 [Mycena olivaceomarginata]|nr:hypothetical protein B0H14DRAFT_2578090 [Mycena olivaceomarginata]